MPQNTKAKHYPTDKIELKEKCGRREYIIEIYTDGSKSPSGVGSGIAIFVKKHLTLQLSINWRSSVPTTRRSSLQL